MNENIVFGVTSGLLSLIGLIAIFVSINTQHNIEKSREILLELTDFMGHYPEGSYKSREKLNWYLQNFIRLTKITPSNFIVIIISSFTVIFVMYTWIHYYWDVNHLFILSASLILAGFIFLILMLSRVVTVGGLIKSENLMTLSPNNKLKVPIPIEKIILNNTYISLNGPKRTVELHFPYEVNITGLEITCHINYHPHADRIKTFYEEKACPLTKSKKYRKIISFKFSSTYDDLFLTKLVTVSVNLSCNSENFLTLMYNLQPKHKNMYEVVYSENFPTIVTGGTSLSFEKIHKKNPFHKLYNLIERIRLSNKPKINEEALNHFKQKIGEAIDKALSRIECEEELTLLTNISDLSEKRDLLIITSSKSNHVIRVSVKELVYDLEVSYESLITLSLIINGEEQDTYKINYIPQRDNRFDVSSLFHDENIQLCVDVWRYTNNYFLEQQQ
ncbi:hypothetical protein ACQKOD_11205 [Bacillus mycoides]|uniref:hypothetical protein n=1 Tax=Bacillus mycoides TaxID=1405 RepID=UPI003D091075